MQSLCLEPLRTSAMASASVSEPWPYFQNARGAYNFAYIDFKMQTSDISSNTFDREPLAGALLCLEAFQRFCKLPHLASTDDAKKKSKVVMIIVISMMVFLPDTVTQYVESLEVRVQHDRT